MLGDAYKTAAKLALENTEIIQKTINEEFILQFNYSEMNKVMRIVKEEQISIINQKLDLNCMYTISVRKKEADKVFKLFIIQKDHFYYNYRLKT